MTSADYYRILGLPVNSSMEQIKKAYRQKARLFHPDLNHSSDAKEKFISVTEAYDFLVTNFDKIAAVDNEAYRQAMEDWRKYRQDRSKQKARVYAQASYSSFKKTQIYKSTRILDGTSIIFSFAISILVIVYTIFGYVYRLKHPIPDYGKPIFSFIMLLMLGMTFFIISLAYLKAYRENLRKQKKKPE